MSFKQEERKAKQYVREELAQNIVDLSLEEQIEYAKDEFEQIIANEQKNIEIMEVQLPMIGKYAALQQKLTHLYLSGNYTQCQIAKILRVTPGTISRWLRLPQIKQAIEVYQQEEDAIINGSLKALRMKAINKASELMDDDNSMVASIMVRDVLDRTGHKATEKKEVNVNLTYEQRLQMIMNDSKEEEKSVNNVVDNVDYSVRSNDDLINGDGSNDQNNTEGDVSK